MMMLEIKNLTKEYRRGDKRFLAVDNVSFSVSRGEFIAIKGRSGSGKSTLLNMIGGLLRPDAGNIVFEGSNIEAMPDGEISGIRGTKIGFVPQGGSLLANLTVLDNIRLPFYFYQKDGNSYEKALKLLENVGIAHLAGMYPSELSGGEMRRVSIARALINDPALIIADEPTGDLDLETTKEILNLFKNVSQSGTAVLIVTHEQETIFSDRIFSMSSGKLRDVTDQ